jgi:hypothetical protein
MVESLSESRERGSGTGVFATLLRTRVAPGSLATFRRKIPDIIFCFQEDLAAVRVALN